MTEAAPFSSTTAPVFSTSFFAAEIRSAFTSSVLIPSSRDISPG